jgi:hypothetical protein
MGNLSMLFGGGAFGGSAAPCTLSNCTISANTVSAGQYSGSPAVGGGTYNCTVNNSILSGNQAIDIYGDTRQVLGGGAAGGVLNNCILFKNTANWYFGSGGGGAYNAVLNNCSVVGNSTYANGGGTYICTVYNSILRFNGANYAGGTFSYCCTTPLPAGIGNFVADPAFVNASGGDLHLLSSSPCINSGRNSYVSGSVDLDGNPRIVAGTVDIGAYEYQTPTSVISYAWLQQYGLPTNGSADYVDSDGDGMSNWQEWIAGTNPTNALSVLAMLVPTNNGSGITVTWQSVATRSYYLQAGTNLSGAPMFQTIQTNIPGQAGTTSVVDTNANPGAGQYFYRVGVQN